MFTRVTLVACLTLAPWPVAAQPGSYPGGSRIRISGPAVYEMPGVVRIQGDTVTGTRVVSTTGAWIQFEPLQGERILTVPKSRQRVSGRVLGVDNAIVTLLPDGHSDSIHVPLTGIARLEVSHGRRASRARAIAGGIAAGVGGFFGGAFVGFAMCADFFNCDGAALLEVNGAIPRAPPRS